MTISEPVDRKEAGEAKEVVSRAKTRVVLAGFGA
jgi:hypothetical protein